MRANSTTSNTPQLAPENHIQQNEWAVASAAQALLGRVSPNALAVALALAAHVPFDGSRLKVWPSWVRLLLMCGIGSKSTLSRVLEELEGHGLIEVARPQDRRKSNRYILNYVTVPDHVVDRTLRGVERASQPVENPAVRGTETGPLRGTETVLESLQYNSIKKEKEKETLEASVKKEKEKARSAFEDKSPRPLAKPVECVEPTVEARREWVKAKLSKLPAAATMPDHQPWLKRGLTRRQWLREKRKQDLSSITRKAG